jgi:hypothetical protein
MTITTKKEEEEGGGGGEASKCTAIWSKIVESRIAISRLSRLYALPRALEVLIVPC